MEEHVVKILVKENVTHDVRRFRVEKPEGYSFLPGQATEVSINSPQWKEEKRPFTFTSLNAEPELEFTIKIYPDHNGVTKELDRLEQGDKLIIRDVWGAITYKDKGVFIAGGAGVTPFIAIFRALSEKGEVEGNKLIFANKTAADIILAEEFKKLLGKDFVNILSEEKASGYHYGMISEEFLKKTITDFQQQFYVCGPPPMMDAVTKQLADLGVGKNSITLEL